MSKVEGVILAAGLSSRSGSYKMALPLGDKTVIEKSVAGMAPFVHCIWVVTGWNAGQVEALLQGYDRVRTVFNDRFREGMLSSVKAGVARVRASRFFLLPGDCPLIGPQVYARMLAVQGDVVVPIYDGKKGHPVLFSRRLVPQILALPAGATLRDCIEAQGRVTVEVDDEGILLDLDTPEDYAAMQARQRG